MPSPRIPPLPPSAWSASLRDVLSTMPGGVERPMNVFTTIARHPKLFEAWVRFGGRLLMGGTLPARERELAILRTAGNTGSDYEWAQHARMARDAGLDEAEIEAAGRELGSHPWSESDRLLLRAVDDLCSRCDLPDEIWVRLAERYDERGLIEFTMLVGHYRMLAGVLNSLRVQVERAQPGYP